MFGPAFDYDFLLEVFRLQQDIEQLGQAIGYGLDQICFAPVTEPGTTTRLDQCTVQSIFGYFKNSLVTFNQTTVQNGFVVNYLNILDKCFT